jgi:hypothetical protein
MSYDFEEKKNNNTNKIQIDARNEIIGDFLTHILKVLNIDWKSNERENTRDKFMSIFDNDAQLYKDIFKEYINKTKVKPIFADMLRSNKFIYFLKKRAEHTILVNSTERLFIMSIIEDVNEDYDYIYYTNQSGEIKTNVNSTTRYDLRPKKYYANINTKITSKYYQYAIINKGYVSGVSKFNSYRDTSKIIKEDVKKLVSFAQYIQDEKSENPIEQLKDIYQIEMDKVITLFGKTMDYNLYGLFLLVQDNDIKQIILNVLQNNQNNLKQNYRYRLTKFGIDKMIGVEVDKYIKNNETQYIKNNKKKNIKEPIEMLALFIHNIIKSIIKTKKKSFFSMKNKRTNKNKFTDFITKAQINPTLFKNVYMDVLNNFKTVLNNNYDYWFLEKIQIYEKIYKNRNLMIDIFDFLNNFDVNNNSDLREQISPDIIKEMIKNNENFELFITEMNKNGKARLETIVNSGMQQDISGLIANYSSGGYIKVKKKVSKKKKKSIKKKSTKKKSIKKKSTKKKSIKKKSTKKKSKKKKKYTKKKSTKKK